MANPLLALKALKLGAKVIKKVVKANKVTKKGKQVEHNLGHMVPKNKMNYGRRKLSGSERFKYAEKEPNFKSKGQLPLIKVKKSGTKFKIEKSASGYQKPILKGGQLATKKHDASVKALAKAKRDALKEGKAKNKNIVKKVKYVKAPKGATRQDFIPDSNPNEYGYGTMNTYQPYRNLKKGKK